MFYTYRQNNSGGSFVIDDDVTIYVIVEADSDTDADARAERIGIYFNGCADGRDCECCGDRWSTAWERDGTGEPLIYGEPIGFKSEDRPRLTDHDRWVNPGEPYCYIYYKDGVRISFNKEHKALTYTPSKGN